MEKRDNDLAGFDALEIEALTDEELVKLTGGQDVICSFAACSGCDE